MTKRWKKVMPNQAMPYNDGYPKKPTPDKGNPYEMCALCHITVPQINGQVKNHAAWCSWRKKQEKKLNNSPSDT
jgi:hypothetical protein